MDRLAARPPCARIFACRGWVALVAVATLAMASSGCSILGVAVAKGSRPMVTPAYKGTLVNQSVAVMVAADRPTQREHQRIQLDLAENINAKLMAMTAKGDVSEVKGTQYPRASAPDAVFTFQRNYPQYEWEPVTTVAPMLGVTRVIHIEIDQFTLHADNVLELYRGQMSGRLKVVEVTDGNPKTAKVAFEDRIVSGQEAKEVRTGSGAGDARSTYVSTLNAFAGEAIGRLVTHEAPDDQ